MRFRSLYPVIALGIVAGPLLATTTYTVSFGATLSNLVSCAGYGIDLSGPSPEVASSSPCIAGNGSIAGAAASEPGHVGASASSTGQGSTHSLAALQTTVVFSLLSGAPVDQVLTSLNIGISGTMQASGVLANSEFSDAILATAIGIGSNTFNYRTEVYNERATIITNPNGLTLLPGGRVGGPGFETLNGIFITPVMLVPIGIPVPITLNLQLLAEGASANNNFLNSMDFPIGSDVFNLPSGFTVNSPDMLLVDNRFQPAGSVPEPASSVMMLLGVLALALKKLRFGSR